MTIWSEYRDFPRPDLRPNKKKDKKGAKTSHIGVDNSHFLVLHFGENFMKIGRKISKLHVFIHIFMQFFMSFYVDN